MTLEDYFHALFILLQGVTLEDYFHTHSVLSLQGVTLEDYFHALFFYYRA